MEFEVMFGTAQFKFRMPQAIVHVPMFGRLKVRNSRNIENVIQCACSSNFPISRVADSSNFRISGVACASNFRNFG
eukprot:7859572-Alexandrium_andersonii.AAC.1